MSKKEAREKLVVNSESFGNAIFELKEIEKIQAGPEESDLTTISAVCGAWFTLACC